MRGFRNLDAAWQERLLRAIPDAFQRMVRIAIERAVDFVVIAGDSFDTSRASLADIKLYFDGLHRLDAAGIPAYIITGNHDPFTSWERDTDLLPASAHLMGVGEPSFQLLRRDGRPLCLIGARSYHNQTWNRDRDIAEGISRIAAEQALMPKHPDASAAPFAIGIIHTGLDIDTRKAPATEADLLSRGMDYWACGHLHKALVRPDTHNPRIVFPGCIQGRNARETGRRGCFLVTLACEDAAGSTPSSPASVALESIPTASVVFQGLSVDATTFTTLPDLARHIQSELFRLNGQSDCEDMVVRITLFGRTALAGFLAQPEVLKRLRKRLNDAYPSFFCDALVNRTLLPYPDDPDSPDGRGELFPSLVARIADKQRDRPDEMVNFIQSEFVRLGIEVPESLSRRIADFEDAAEREALGLFQQEKR